MKKSAAVFVLLFSVMKCALASEPFKDVTDSVGLKGMSGSVAAWADFDNDGYLDLATGGRLFRNPGGTHHWLKVRLAGHDKSNAAAIGAQVRLALGDLILTRQVEAATGLGKQNDLSLHFGLGAHGGPVKCEINWPDGSKQQFDTPDDGAVVVRQD